MKIIRDTQDLVGRKIAFIYNARYFDGVVIATEDKELCIVKSYLSDDSDDIETQVLTEVQCLKEISNNTFLRNSLSDLGLFDIEEYNRKRQEEFKRREEERKARELKRERELYERLKAKFENK